MTDAQVKATLSVREVLALTLFGEARGEPVEGKIFVGCVIRNRVMTPGRWPDDYPGVCLQKSQFSCWSEAGGAGNYAAVMTLARAFVGDFHDRPEITPLLRELVYLAEGIAGEQLQDNAGMANHYVRGPFGRVRGRPPGPSGKRRSPKSARTSDSFCEELRLMAMTNQTATTTGWIVFIAGLGMMAGMMAVDIASLKEWSEMQTPVFVGTFVGHLAAVITAFVGGKLIPEAREGLHTRSDDPQPPAA